MDEFANNSAVHQINTRHKSNLHPPLPRLTKYQKGVYYTGIKIFNCLPPKIKQLTGNIRKFKVALKKFLLIGSFYTIEEFLDWTSASDLHTMYMQ